MARFIVLLLFFLIVSCMNKADVPVEEPSIEELEPCQDQYQEEPCRELTQEEMKQREERFREIFQGWDANRFYEQLLRNLELDIPCKCPLMWSRWRLNTWGRIPAVNKNIDSVTAVSIAMKAAEECTGSRMMTALLAKPMGSGEEHWMVYCLPTMPTNEYCYDHLITFHNRGMLFWANAPITGGSDCPKPIAVLISKGSGQVLSTSSWLCQEQEKGVVQAPLLY